MNRSKVSAQQERRSVSLLVRARRNTARTAAVLVALVLTVGGSAAHPAFATNGTLVPIQGSGSTWSSNAMQLWAADVKQYGLNVDFNPNGSGLGRSDFKNKTTDFGVSEIPYGLTDNHVTDYPPSDRKFAYMPIVAGGTSFMYHLTIGGHQVTNLRLSGQTLAKIFTANITNWSDKAIAADNPGITLPARRIVPVVRGDNSGTTAQFTTWLSKTYPAMWNAYCQRAGRSAPCGETSEFPQVPGLGYIAETQSSSVAGEVKDRGGEGTIGYVEFSYAKYANYPVAKILNAAGYYTQPTPGNVAVALQSALINSDPTSPLYLTQKLDNVYTSRDPRTYPLSSYSYMIIPTSLDYPMNKNKGFTLGRFAYYFLCQGQQTVGEIGYSPLPINLVQAALHQVTKIPGVAVENTNIAQCHNPTFTPSGANLLAKTAALPLACDKVGVTMCPNPTGGATTATPVTGGQTTTGTQGNGNGSGSSNGSGSNGSGNSGSGSGNGTGNGGGSNANTSSGSGGSGSGNTNGGSGSGKANTGTTANAPAGAGATGTTKVGKTHVIAVNPKAIDPEQSGLSADQQNDGSIAGGAVTAVPVTLAGSTGWTVDDTLMVFAVLIFVGLVVGPPIISRRLSRTPPS